MSSSSRPWRLWIDTGGTFTDCLALDPRGALHRTKILSSGALRGRVEARGARTVAFECLAGIDGLPDEFFRTCSLSSLETEGNAISVEHSSGNELTLEEPWQGGAREAVLCSPEGAPVLCARIVTRTGHGARLPPVEVRFATTRGTNALLERSGQPTVFFVTSGFRDLLVVGTQQRPDLFALHVERAGPLYGRVIEVEERMQPDGSVESGLDAESFRAQALQAIEDGYRAAAVAFLHSYRNPRHELEAAEFLRELGFEHVSISAALSPRIRIVQRAQTAVVDAYLAGVVRDYLGRLERDLGAGSLHVMTSAGGLRKAAEYQAKDSLLSGPAAGVVGATASAGFSHEHRLLAFDMGGTSTDVARHDGRFEYRSETVVEDVRISSPSLAVETVAAGGGSVCRFVDRQLKVGPESAGADPGPACYGRGGPLALTDVNLLLGRLPQLHFPFRIDREAAESMARQVWLEHQQATGSRVSIEELLFGFLTIANETMAGAVRGISLRAGYRPADYVLVTFGGAGPQHACALAELLGMVRVMVPQDASLLSALGLGHARIVRFVERQVLQPLELARGSAADWFEQLREQAFSLLSAEGIDPEEAVVERREIWLRFAGQESTLPLDWSPTTELETEFRSLYEGHFGYRPEEHDIEVESLRLVATGPAAERENPARPEDRAGMRKQPETGRFFGTSGWVDGTLVQRQSLTVDDRVAGPAWVVEDHTVTLVEPGWLAWLDRAGALMLETT